MKFEHLTVHRPRKRAAVRYVSELDERVAHPPKKKEASLEVHQGEKDVEAQTTQPPDQPVPYIEDEFSPL